MFIPAYLIAEIVVKPFDFFGIGISSRRRPQSWPWQWWWRRLALGPQDGASTHNDDESSESCRLTTHLVLCCGLYVFAVVSHQMIKWKTVGRGEKDWTFGQVMSLFVLLVPADLFGVYVQSRPMTSGGR